MVLFGCLQLKGALGKSQLDVIKKHYVEDEGLEAGRTLESIAKVMAKEKLKEKCIKGYFLIIA